MTRHIIPWTSAGVLDRFFDDALMTDGFAPAIDVYQDKDHVIVEAAITGVKPEDVEVTVETTIGRRFAADLSPGRSSSRCGSRATPLRHAMRRACSGS